MSEYIYGSREKIKPPCKDCTDRKIGCHSECKAYQDYNAIREMIREKKRTAMEYYRQYPKGQMTIDEWLGGRND